MDKLIKIIEEQSKIISRILDAITILQSRQNEIITKLESLQNHNHEKKLI